MTDILNRILYISITGAAATIIVCIARLILRIFGDRSGSVAKRIMWIAVVICFLCPLRITLPYHQNIDKPITDLTSVPTEQGDRNSAAGINDAEISSDPAVAVKQPENSGKVIQNGKSPIGHFASAEDKIASAIIRMDLSRFIISGLSECASAMILTAMFASAIVVLSIGAAQYSRLRYRLSGSTQREDGVWICSEITSPCTVGFIKPRIYLPKNMSSANAEYAVLHERAHIRCFDHIIKPIAYLAFAFNVFNPFAWIMLRLFYADMESHCDAVAVRDMAQNEKIEYCKAMVDCASSDRAILYSTFGTDNIKRRINSVMKHRRAPIVLTAAITAVTLILCGCTIFSVKPTVAFSDIDDAGGKFTKEISNISGVRISCEQGVAFVTDEADISDVMSYFRQLQVGKKEINRGRGDDRDHTVQLAFIDGHDGGTTRELNISADYNEIYCNDFVKPTLSYRVADPEGLKAIILGYISNIDNCRYTPFQVLYLAPYSSASPNFFTERSVEAEYTLSTDFTASATSGYITTDHIENARYEPIEVGDTIRVLDAVDGGDQILDIDISDYASVSAYRLYKGGRIAHIIYLLDDEIWISSWRGNNVTANVENPFFSCDHVFKLAKSENFR